MSLETVLPQLEDPAQPLSASALTQLSSLDDSARDEFLRTWSRLSVQRRRDVIERLGGLAEDNAELDFNAVFLAALADVDVQVRADAIKALWEYDGRDLARALLSLLRDPEALVRAEAALALGRIVLRAELDGVDEAKPIEQALRDVILDERELPEVRGRALEAVGAARTPWVHDAIQDAYDVGDRRLRISAVHAMGRNVDPAWLPIVSEEMYSDDAELRFEAALAAGSIGDEEAVPHLAALVTDEDAEVQEAAIEALGQIGGEAAREILADLAAGSVDDRIAEAASDALSEAEFVHDPLGVRARVAAAGDEPDDLDEFAE